MNKTIRRQPGALPVQEKIIGSFVFVKTYAGPIVRLKVEEVRNSSYVGTIHPEDEERLYLAGVAKCDESHVCWVPKAYQVTRKEYEDEDWKIWIVRKKLQK
jgi:hypothetical protein